MILSDREIQAALARKAIFITPPPPAMDEETESGEKSLWASTALDLRLDKQLTIWEKAHHGEEITFLSPDDPKFDMNHLLAKYAKVFDIPCSPSGLSPPLPSLCRIINDVSEGPNVGIAARRMD